MKKKIFIGVGHGGSDPGAVANGVHEADLNLSIALACRDALERHDVTVRMSRTRDEEDSLSEEIRECNAFSPDYAIDIHNNAGGGDGAEVFHSKADGSDDTFAKNVLDEIKAIGQNSRGMKTKLITAGANNGKDYFGFIRQIKAPSVLVECAFVDNKADLAIIDTPEEQKIMGIAIAKGILKTLGIKYKDPAATPAKTPESAAAVKAGDLVSISAHATYYNGRTVPYWVKRYNWYVDSVSGDRAVIGRNEGGSHNINSPIHIRHLTACGGPSISADSESFFPARGYFQKGDASPNVGKVAAFMRANFPLYTSEKALGDIYGPNLMKAIMEFQRRTGLEPDGCLGPITLAKLEEFGFSC